VVAVGCGGRQVGCGDHRWGRSGVRVLAEHDHAWWGLGFLDVGGGRDRPDAQCAHGARCGAPVPWRFFANYGGP
jgi:hypothetical protein